MTLPLVLCVHSPSTRRLERLPALAAIAALAAYPDEWETRPVEVVRPWSYALALADAWDHPGELVNVEHDLVVTPEHVRALLKCPAERCAWAYWASPAATGQFRPTLFGRPEMGVNDPWCERPAIGLIKMSRAVRPGVFPTAIDYKKVEYAIWERAGGPWHVHWPPVEHLHGFREGAYDRGRSTAGHGGHPAT